MTPEAHLDHTPFIILPLYVYPCPKAWDPLFSAIKTHSCNFVVIVNPNNGPGHRGELDSNYIAGLRALSAASNVKVLGYVYCSYGARPLVELEEDIETYYSWMSDSRTLGGPYQPPTCGPSAQQIRVDGIFFDEAPFESELVDNMTAIASSTRAIFGQQQEAAGTARPPLVIYNPGIFANPAFYESADYVVIFENEVAKWESDYVQVNLAELPDELRTRSITIGHSAASIEKELEFVNKAVVSAGLAGHFVTAALGYTEFCPNWEQYVRYAEGLARCLGP